MTILWMLVLDLQVQELMGRPKNMVYFFLFLFLFFFLNLKFVLFVYNFMISV